MYIELAYGTLDGVIGATGRPENLVSHRLRVNSPMCEPSGPRTCQHNAREPYSTNAIRSQRTSETRTHLTHIHPTCAHKDKDLYQYAMSRDVSTRPALVSRSNAPRVSLSHRTLNPPKLSPHSPLPAHPPSRRPALQARAQRRRLVLGCERVVCSSASAPRPSAPSRARVPFRFTPRRRRCLR
jgi:hypothetical protein